MCWFYTHILAPVCRYIAGALIKIYFRQMRVKILDNIDKEVLSQRFETICVGTWQTGFIIFLSMYCWLVSCSVYRRQVHSLFELLSAAYTFAECPLLPLHSLKSADAFQVPTGSGLHDDSRGQVSPPCFF